MFGGKQTKTLGEETWKQELKRGDGVHLVTAIKEGVPEVDTTASGVKKNLCKRFCKEADMGNIYMLYCCPCHACVVFNKDVEAMWTWVKKGYSLSKTENVKCRWLSEVFPRDSHQRKVLQDTMIMDAFRKRETVDLDIKAIQAQQKMDEDKLYEKKLQAKMVCDHACLEKLGVQGQTTDGASEQDEVDTQKL